MPIIQKVTDPTKVVTDEQVLNTLATQGIDKDYVEFFEDYNAKHPCAKFYRDLKSNKRFMAVSGLPKVKPDGKKIEVGWVKKGNTYISKPNLFLATIKGEQASLVHLKKQVTWQPQLFLNGIEQTCGKTVLLDTDPTNENYHQNVLEWNYGICRRRVRLIEGSFLERWIFSENPNGEVRIVHNQTGNLPLKLGRYAISSDVERIPAVAFINPMFGYPFEVSASLTAYSTASDGYIYDGDAVYATAQGNANGDLVADNAEDMTTGQLLTGGIYYVYRVFPFFDTSALGAGAVVTAWTLGLYGKSDGSDTDFLMTIMNGQPTYPTDPLEVGDYALANYSGNGGSLTTVGFSTAGYNTITGTEMGWITKEGTTKLAVVSSRDIAITTPDGNEYVNVYTNNKGTGFKPKLIVTYTDHKLATPSTLALSLTEYAPVLKLKVTPSTLALSLITYIPAILITESFRRIATMTGRDLTSITARTLQTMTGRDLTNFI